MWRRSRAASGATNRRVRLAGIGRGRTSPAAIGRGATSRRVRGSVRGRESRPIDPVHRASANPGRTNRRPAHRPTIGRGRPSRRDRAHSGSHGSANRRAIGRGATSRPDRSGPGRERKPWSDKAPTGTPRGDRPWRDKPAGGPPRGDRPWSGKPPDRSGPPRGDRPPDARRNPADRRPSGGGWSGKPAAAGGRSAWSEKPPRAAAHRAVIVRGAASRAIRIASRSRRAVRAPVEAALRPASGATTRTDEARWSVISS